MQISTDLIARQPVRLMDEPTCSDEIYTVDYLYRIYILITYENQKNKNTRNITKNGVWLPTLLAMHAQTNLNQGLLQVPPPLPSHPLLTLKDETANERIFVPTRKEIN